jgi:hypothetical protein
VKLSTGKAYCDRPAVVVLTKSAIQECTCRSFKAYDLNLAEMRSSFGDRPKYAR